MATILTPDIEKEEAVKSDPLRPTLNFDDSMDPKRVEEIANLKQEKIDQIWAAKVDRDQEERDKKAAWHRYQEYVKRQGGVDDLNLPWSTDNWYEKFTDWEKRR